MESHFEFGGGLVGCNLTSLCRRFRERLSARLISGIYEIWTGRLEALLIVGEERSPGVSPVEGNGNEGQK